MWMWTWTGTGSFLSVVVAFVELRSRAPFQSTGMAVLREMTRMSTVVVRGN